MSKFSDYLEGQKIDPRRILVGSKKLEALTDEDRAIKLARRRAKGGDEKAKEQAEKKPRSGRPVNPATLTRAMEGRSLTAATRTRLLRAVQAVAAQKKKGEVSLADLF